MATTAGRNQVTEQLEWGKFGHELKGRPDISKKMGQASKRASECRRKGKATLRTAGLGRTDGRAGGMRNRYHCKGPLGVAGREGGRRVRS